MSIMNPKIHKYSDLELAQLLWPVYLDTGNLEKVLAHAKKLKDSGEISEGISKPTLLKMKDHFGWEAEREQALKSQFKGTLDQSGDLESMLVDLTTIKNSLGEKVQGSIDKDLHQIYGQHVAQILKIKDMLKKEQGLDKAGLLVKSFQVVVKFLTESGQEQAAEILADSLEFLAKRVEAEWQS